VSKSSALASMVFLKWVNFKIPFTHDKEWDFCVISSSHILGAVGENIISEKD
jgi:hypothetical protein